MPMRHTDGRVPDRLAAPALVVAVLICASLLVACSHNEQPAPAPPDLSVRLDAAPPVPRDLAVVADPPDEAPPVDLAEPHDLVDTCPGWNIWPQTLDFGSIAVRTTVKKYFFLTNNWPKRKPIGPISMKGHDSGEFRMADVFIPQLEAGESVGFGVVYAPIAAGKHTDARVEVWVNDRNCTPTVALTGSAF